MLSRIATLLTVLLLALSVGACGGDAEQESGGEVAGEAGSAAQTSPADTVDQLSEAGPPYNLNEVETLLERAGLNVNRLAIDQSTGVRSEIDIPTLQSARYQEARTTEKFDLLVFPSQQAAREAISQLRETDVVEDGGMIVTGENVVAVAEERFDSPTLDTVQDVLRDLPPNPAHGGTTGGGGTTTDGS